MSVLLFPATTAVSPEREGKRSGIWERRGIGCTSDLERRDQHWIRASVRWKAAVSSPKCTEKRRLCTPNQVCDVSRQHGDADLIRGGLVSRSSPKKPRSRSIFKALFCCLSAQNVSRPGGPCEAPTQKEEAQSTPKADLLQCLQYQFYQIPGTSLLPEVAPKDKGKICMVIDLDETLVHSSFKPISNADFVVPVEIEGTTHQVYVLKRPYVDEFLERMGQLYECVLFTASLAKYADPVTDLLDREGVFSCRLFREACVFHQGCYVKDLSRLGRDLKKTIILDNSPASYIFHPENAVPVQSWFDDMGDTELLSLIPIFEELSDTEDIYTSLGQLRAP